LLIIAIGAVPEVPVLPSTMSVLSSAVPVPIPIPIPVPVPVPVPVPSLASSAEERGVSVLSSAVPVPVPIPIPVPVPVLVPPSAEERGVFFLKKIIF
jgi:hypothetical protein